MIAGSWVLEAAALWHACAERGIRHLHAHLPGTAPAVAMLAARLGNSVDGAARTWTWSLTVHGPYEFFDVEGEALAAKVDDAAFAVSVSDFGRSQLMALVDEDQWDKLHVVHCGVDPGALAPAARAGRDGPLELLSVGRLTRVKGQAVLLDAVARAAAEGLDVHLTIVGDGEDRADLERLAARLGVADRVTFAGAVGQDAIAAHYGAADLFVLSSFAEGLPVVLMEAMAMELPVIASGVMGVPELVRDGVNGRVVRPGRADELAAAIAELGRDPERRRALGVAGRATVRDEFHVERSARQLAELFSGCAGP